MSTTGVKLNCTCSKQVSDVIDTLLSAGLHGNSRAEVIERLLCHAVEALVERGLLPNRHFEETISTAIVGGAP